ncbi:MAG: FtsQ-type POTRA domain-containing protein [bacterium]|nr:FtsQ-type POTRA domain-containing protein [bacterium]
MLPKRNHYNKIKRLGAGGGKFFYSKKTYKNPFFQRRKISGQGRGRRLSPKLRLALIAGTAAVIVIAWLLFFSSLFKINGIEVSGAPDGPANEVKSIAGAIAADKFFGRNNLLLFGKGRLSAALNEKYYLQNLTIKKSWPHTLKIYLRERQPAAIWLEDGKYFQIDGQGDIISQVDPLNINRQSLPLIENLAGSKIVGRKTNAEQPSIDCAIGLFNEFKGLKHGFEAEKFIIDHEIRTVKMAILDGPRIYFRAGNDTAEQAARLDLIIKEKLKNDFRAKTYIDLRFGGNVYIK